MVDAWAGLVGGGGCVGGAGRSFGEVGIDLMSRSCRSLGEGLGRERGGRREMLAVWMVGF